MNCLTNLKLAPTEQLLDKDRVEFSMLDKGGLIKLGLSEEFLSCHEPREMLVHNKTGEINNAGGENAFYIKLEGEVHAVVTFKLPSDNLTIVAVVCHKTIRYFIIKCGANFAFFNRPAGLSRLLNEGIADMSTFIAGNLLTSSLQTGPNVYYKMNRLANNIWNRLIWASGTNDKVKFNLILRQDEIPIKAGLYLDRLKPSANTISLNGHCHMFKLGGYPAMSIKKTVMLLKVVKNKHSNPSGK